MLVTEEQAKEKWCPFARIGVLDDEHHIIHGPFNRDGVDEERTSSAKRHVVGFCLGSRCMAWRWIYEWRDTEDRTREEMARQEVDWERVKTAQGNYEKRLNKDGDPKGFCSAFGKPINQVEDLGWMDEGREP